MIASRSWHASARRRDGLCLLANRSQDCVTMQSVPTGGSSGSRDDVDCGVSLTGDDPAASCASSADPASLGDSGDADDRRLSELGRRTIEMFAVAHIFAVKLQKAYQEEQSNLKARELIEQEDAARAAESERQIRKAEADKERRAKKKVR